MKECTESSCHNPQFGGGYCKYHQWLRKRQGGDLFKRNTKPKKPIAKESPKRKKEHKRYTELVDEHRIKCKEEGTYFCFFCLGEEDLSLSDKWLCNHHWEERGANYLNVETWSWAHNSCHNMFHFAPLEILEKEDWYNDFMIRLKSKSIVGYSKQKRKEEKTLEDLFG